MTQHPNEKDCPNSESKTWNKWPLASAATSSSEQNRTGTAGVSKWSISAPASGMS